MSLPKIDPTSTNAWKKLEDHFSKISEVHMKDLFSSEMLRKESMSIEWQDITFDFSKNRITKETITLLLQLAEEVCLEDAITAQFAGDIINETENRAVLHTALRDYREMKPEVKGALSKMEQFSETIISGNRKGYTGKQITDIVNIGIGGSDLGPAMVTEALTYYKNHLKLHYISNVDGDHIAENLQKLDPETTLFIIVSKSFTTQETLTNAQTIRKWFLNSASEKEIEKHFIAVSTNIEAVTEFGISENNIFPMWNWVGGRFSLWSAVGLSTCCAIGYKNFEDLLKGAHQMDTHFKNSPFKDNIPVLMALISIWYTNFFNTETEAVLPYSHYLLRFIDYLQQATMESNGKSVDRNDTKILYQTAPIVWGSVGTNAQHAFFQLLHQGTKIVPSDFICFTQSLHGNKEHQEKLLANCHAQTDALLEGTYGKKIDNPFKKFEGNKPSNLLQIEKLTPASLGKLIAIYEHKLFVQGVIWNIYSYDQWGVELGKKLANERLNKRK